MPEQRHWQARVILPNLLVQQMNVVHPAGPAVGAPVAVLARRRNPGGATIGCVNNVAVSVERLGEPLISSPVLRQPVLDLHRRLGCPFRRELPNVKVNSVGCL